MVARSLKKYLHTRYFNIFLFVCISTNVALGSDEAFSKKITLDEEGAVTLSIVENTDEQNVSVILESLDGMLRQVSVIEGASMRAENIQQARFNSQSKAYFLTAWNRGSTYGHQTNIIVWYRAETKDWAMIVAPFYRGELVDMNKDGMHEIANGPIRPTDKTVFYRFDNGKFVPII